MNKALEILKDIRTGSCFDKYMNMTNEEIELYFDEAIAELEALQSKSCDTCEYDGTFRYMGKDSKCTRCCNFFSSRYVPKG